MAGTYKVNGDKLTGLTVYSTLPVGTIILYGGSVIPTGFLICNGDAISRTDYADLFSKIGTTYGAGDGSTTFNIPTKTEVGYTVIIKAVDYVSLPQNAIDDEHTTTGNVHSAAKTSQVIDTKINNAKAWKKIFDNPTRQALATITLSEDITNYNEIMLIGTRVNGRVTVPLIYPVEVIQTLTDTDAIGLRGYGDYLYLKYTDAHTLTRTSADNYVMHSVFVR